MIIQQQAPNMSMRKKSSFYSPFSFSSRRVRREAVATSPPDEAQKRLNRKKRRRVSRHKKNTLLRRTRRTYSTLTKRSSKRLRRVKPEPVLKDDHNTGIINSVNSPSKDNVIEGNVSSPNSTRNSPQKSDDEKYKEDDLVIIPARKSRNFLSKNRRGFTRLKDVRNRKKRYRSNTLGPRSRTSYLDALKIYGGDTKKVKKVKKVKKRRSNRTSNSSKTKYTVENLQKYKFGEQDDSYKDYTAVEAEIDMLNYRHFIITTLARYRQTDLLEKITDQLPDNDLRFFYKNKFEKWNKKMREMDS